MLSSSSSSLTRPTGDNRHWMWAEVYCCSDLPPSARSSSAIASSSSSPSPSSSKVEVGVSSSRSSTRHNSAVVSSRPVSASQSRSRSRASSSAEPPATRYYRAAYVHVFTGELRFSGSQFHIADWSVRRRRTETEQHQQQPAQGREQKESSPVASTTTDPATARSKLVYYNLTTNCERPYRWASPTPLSSAADEQAAVGRTAGGRSRWLALHDDITGQAYVRACVRACMRACRGCTLGCSLVCPFLCVCALRWVLLSVRGSVAWFCFGIDAVAGEIG